MAAWGQLRGVGVRVRVALPPYLPARPRARPPPLCNSPPPPPSPHPAAAAGSNQAIRWLVFTKAKEYFAGPGGDVNKLSVMHTIAASVMAGTASVYG